VSNSRMSNSTTDSGDGGGGSTTWLAATLVAAVAALTVAVALAGNGEKALDLGAIASAMGVAGLGQFWARYADHWLVDFGLKQASNLFSRVALPAVGAALGAWYTSRSAAKDWSKREERTKVNFSLNYLIGLEHATAISSTAEGKYQLPHHHDVIDHPHDKQLQFRTLMERDLSKLLNGNKFVMEKFTKAEDLTTPAHPFIGSELDKGEREPCGKWARSSMAVKTHTGTDWTEFPAGQQEVIREHWAEFLRTANLDNYTPLELTTSEKSEIDFRHMRFTDAVGQHRLRRRGGEPGESSNDQALSKEDLSSLHTAVMNEISEKYSDGYFDMNVGLKSAWKTYYFGVTYETCPCTLPDSDKSHLSKAECLDQHKHIPHKKLRVMLVEKGLLDDDIIFEEEPKFERPTHEPRWECLREMGRLQRVGEAWNRIWEVQIWRAAPATNREITRTVSRLSMSLGSDDALWEGQDDEDEPDNGAPIPRLAERDGRKRTNSVARGGPGLRHTATSPARM